jgi:hypothetical protein
MMMVDKITNKLVLQTLRNVAADDDYPAFFHGPSFTLF